MLIIVSEYQAGLKAMPTCLDLPEGQVEVKHPYYDTTLTNALNLARLLKYVPLPKSVDPLPTPEEALSIIRQELPNFHFNWITGRVAIDLLEYVVEQKPMSSQV